MNPEKLERRLTKVYGRRVWTSVKSGWHIRQRGPRVPLWTVHGPVGEYGGECTSLLGARELAAAKERGREVRSEEYVTPAHLLGPLADVRETIGDGEEHAYRARRALHQTRPAGRRPPFGLSESELAVGLSDVRHALAELEHARDAIDDAIARLERVQREWLERA